MQDPQPAALIPAALQLMLYTAPMSTACSTCARPAQVGTMCSTLPDQQGGQHTTCSIDPSTPHAAWTPGLLGQVPHVAWILEQVLCMQDLAWGWGGEKGSVGMIQLVDQPYTIHPACKTRCDTPAIIKMIQALWYSSPPQGTTFH